MPSAISRGQNHMAWAGPSGGFGETTGRTAEKSLRSKSTQSTSAVSEVTLLKVLDDDAHAGKNNGFAGTAPHQQDIKMTGTAVWAVREDGKLLSNHVERAALEQVQRLTSTTS